jgi:transcriptional regulator with XRE-family HTH domain
MDQNIVGHRIKIARKMSNPSLTQEDLVARLQAGGLDYMDQAKISRIESGSRPVYDYEIVVIAKCLRVSVNWLLEIEN